MPGVVAEGRRVIANVERVANLFVTKTVYAMLLAIAVGVARWPYPFLPRHLTIISSLTIGIPAFFLALGPSSRRYVPGFVRRVLRFAGRAGLVAAAATFVGLRDRAARSTDVSLDEARTAATIMLLARRALGPRDPGAAVHAGAGRAARRDGRRVRGRVAIPGVRHFFALDMPPARACVVVIAVGGRGCGAALVLELGSRVAAVGRPQVRRVSS